MKLVRCLWLILCTATFTLAHAQEEPKEKGADKKAAPMIVVMRAMVTQTPCRP